MLDLKPFTFSNEFIESVKEIRTIPVHFYNKEGQILIYKKENISEKEIDGLIKFKGRGIYFDNADIKDLVIYIKPGNEIPESLTNTKLINKDITAVLTNSTENLFSHIKSTSLESTKTQQVYESMETVFSDFYGQEDVITGLINILDMMKYRNTTYDVKLAVKRIVVAMALKTRSMHAVLRYKDRARIKESVTDLMMSSMLCDIGCYQMHMPITTGLSVNNMTYIKKHPFLSYLMVAHDPVLTTNAKHSILTHHRPCFDDKKYNNYPGINLLMNKLEELIKDYCKDHSKLRIAKDMAEQLNRFKTNIKYNEDANVLAISSEYASLTSDVPWRKAYSSEKAVKLIINNSFFTYTSRILQEFLDYIAISLCDNKKVLRDGDFIVITTKTHSGSPIFEICRIDSIGHFQSRPYVKKIGVAPPVFSEKPKLKLLGFDLSKMKKDPEKIFLDLSQDKSQRIIYFIDPVLDKDLYKCMVDLTS